MTKFWSSWLRKPEAPRSAFLVLKDDNDIRLFHKLGDAMDYADTQEYRVVQSIPVHGSVAAAKKYDAVQATEDIQLFEKG